MIFKRFSLVALMAAAPVPISANEFTNIRNGGGFACSDVIVSLESAGRELEKTAFLQWAAGFSTAASRANNLIDIFPLGDTWELVRMTWFVCQENPQATYEEALRTTIGRLRPMWVATTPELLQLDSGTGAAVLLYQESVVGLQSLLRDKGYEITADGAYGNQTGRTISAFRSDIGLTPMLVPDGEFLYHITRP